MIKSEVTFRIVCDDCSLAFGDDEGQAWLFGSGQDAWDAAREDGWTTTGHRHYCPDCLKHQGGESL